MSAESAAAFAAREAIAAGLWDAHLHLINEALRARMGRPEYKAEILARAEFRAAAEQRIRGPVRREPDRLQDIPDVPLPENDGATP